MLIIVLLALVGLCVLAVSLAHKAHQTQLIKNTQTNGRSLKPWHIPFALTGVTLGANVILAFVTFAKFLHEISGIGNGYPIAALFTSFLAALLPIVGFFFMLAEAATVCSVIWILYAIIVLLADKICSKRENSQI